MFPGANLGTDRGLPVQTDDVRLFVLPMSHETKCSTLQHIVNFHGCLKHFAYAVLAALWTLQVILLTRPQPLLFLWMPSYCQLLLLRTAMCTSNMRSKSKEKLSTSATQKLENTLNKSIKNLSWVGRFTDAFR